MTTYFCMRHGLTEWNRDSKIQGNTDISLCDEGREMARQWAKSLAGGGLECILTSSLDRSKETAAIINEVLGLPVYEDERLGEQDWGDWTGLTKIELKGLGKVLRKQENKGFEFRPPGGESRNELLMRACDALTEFPENHEEQSVLVVTHNGILRALAYGLSGLDYLYKEKNPLMEYRLHRILCMDNELAIGELNMEL